MATAGCGGNPTHPSESSTANVAGTVNTSGAAPKAVHAVSGTPAAGLVVTVVGTNLSAIVDASGYFQIGDVPSGSVRLQFSAESVNATTEPFNVKPEELVEIHVEVSASTAMIVNEVRSAAKMSLCHSTGHGSYRLITISESAAPAHRKHGDGQIGEPVPGQSGQAFSAGCAVN